MAVLIVDDNRNYARFLRSALVTRGYGARAVATCKEALHAVEEDSFDLFLIDIRLPDGDGRKLIHRLRGEHGVTPGQIVLMTALPREQMGDTRELTANPVLYKPFRLSGLLEQLRERSAAG